MKPSRVIITWLAIVFSLIALTGVVHAHITPTIVLMSDRDAVVGMLTGASRFFIREVKLSPEERRRIETEWGWKPDKDLYQFYIGRDSQGRLVGAVIFLTEFTTHGPVRAAVDIGHDGRVKDARVVEVTQEAYYWLKPLLDQNFTSQYVGRDSRGSFAPSGRFSAANMESMPYYYAQIVASLIQRGAILSEVTLRKKGGET